MAEEEDDYLTMSFGDDAGRKPETSLQRRMRREREGRERGRIPSKAELARQADAEREAALRRSLFEAGAASQAKKPASKGLAMMAKMGFVAGQALGRRREDEKDEKDGQNKDDGQQPGHDRKKDRPLTEPIRIQVKRDRAGIGASRGDENGDGDEDGGGGDAGAAAKRPRLDDVDPLAYRDRIRQERETARLERQLRAAQGVAERMSCGDGDGGGDGGGGGDGMTAETTALADVNVLWRGLVRERRQHERERARRIAAQRRLDRGVRMAFGGGTGAGTGTGADADADADTGADDADPDEDDDDRQARGRGPAQSFLDGGLRRTVVSDGEDSAGDDHDDHDGNEDDGDTELAAFEALPPRERLQQVVDWLRARRRYCFWCKCAYPDEAMDGCPGRTEEDHD